MKKTLAIFGALIMLIVIWRIFGIFGDGGNGEGAGRRSGAERAVAVEIEMLKKGTVRDIGLFTGSLAARSSFIAAPKVSGHLNRLLVDIGDAVSSGQIIAELDDQEYRLQAAQARAERAVAKANVKEVESTKETARRELERVEALRAKKVVSESELDEVRALYTASEAKHQVALAEVERRSAALSAAELRLSYTRVMASWRDEERDRVVGERYADEGDLLSANSPIVSIIDNSVMTALIDVIERDYPRMSVGQEAVIETDAYPGREFEGKIARIAPLLKEASRQARVEIEIPNPDRALKPGMFVRVRIQFERHENVTTAPFSAIARREGRQGVFLADLENKTAEFIPVELGIVEGELAEIIEPEISGYVVTLGHYVLESGSSIQLPQQSGSGKQEESGLEENKGEREGR